MWSQFVSTTQFYLYGRRHCTRTGYLRARAALLKAGPDPLESADLRCDESVCMVTGANSGVGMEVAQFLATKGSTVYMVCRSAKRAEEARRAIIAKSGNDKIHLLIGDLSLEADVRRVWDEFVASRGGSASAPPRLDVLVCNAGVLLNEKTLTSENVETTLACHLLFGTYLLGSLAMPALEATKGSRLVCVSSGGMYNAKFPAWEVAMAERGTYNGNMAYCYAKRGQVLLMERWGEAHPSVKFVSCHPGWAQTPAVDAAYGDAKKYLEPMRSPWEGAEGIAWLCVAEAELLESGAFYLDRKAEVKHLAGPFFTEGSATKNTRAEVDAMMFNLDAWSNGRREEAAQAAAEAAARAQPLKPSETPVDMNKFAGRWYVLAQLPTPLDKGARNSVEEYVWNEAKQRMEVNFTMQFDKGGKVTEILQRAKVVNPPTNTRWSLSPKLGVFLPLGISYLVLDCAEDYSTTIIGVPNRSYLYVMARSTSLPEGELDGLLDKCKRLGYDMNKVDTVEHDEVKPTPPTNEAL